MLKISLSERVWLLWFNRYFLYMWLRIFIICIEFVNIAHFMPIWSTVPRPHQNISACIVTSWMHSLFSKASPALIQMVRWRIFYISKLKALRQNLSIKTTFSSRMLSFSMFLLLSLNETDLVRRIGPDGSCPHSIHRDQFTCFAKGDLVAFFKVSPIIYR